MNLHECASEFEVEDLIALEAGDVSEFETILIFQRLINCGAVWRLQGHYGRVAKELIDAGRCMLGPTAQIDYFGSTVPSRYDVEAGTPGSPEYVNSFVSSSPTKMTNETIHNTGPDSLAELVIDLVHEHLTERDVSAQECAELREQVKQRISELFPEANLNHSLKVSEKSVMTPPELAKFWGVSPDKILAWIRSGELKATNVAQFCGEIIVSRVRSIGKRSVRFL